ncbi:MAG TPA: hypothetical protein VLC50_02260 [Actinomycetes bacterium]|nr:hypothetical protein [Actinomycetes bacterium]
MDGDSVEVVTARSRDTGMVSAGLKSLLWNTVHTSERGARDTLPTREESQAEANAMAAWLATNPSPSSSLVVAGTAIPALTLTVGGRLGLGADLGIVHVVIVGDPDSVQSYPLIQVTV